MQRIRIICVGKIKEKYFVMAVAEYQKRLSKYCRLELIELPDEKTPDGASELMMDGIRKKEADRILKSIGEEDYVIALEIQGKMLDSVELAQNIQKLAVNGKSSLAFIIGGSLGLHENVCRRAQEHLSFSKMTFPHQLMRVILLEQIYRSYRILCGEPYHK